MNIKIVSSYFKVKEKKIKERKKQVWKSNNVKLEKKPTKSNNNQKNL
jgi:hypothetical protein